MSRRVARMAGRKSARPLSIDTSFGTSGRRSVPCAPLFRNPSPAAVLRECRRKDNRRAVSASRSRPLP
eukprot:4147768-Pleurochrysis_carterae.AAC.1